MLTIYLKDISYNMETTIIDEVYMRFKDYGIYKLSGLNGKGKTTLLKALNAEINVKEEEIVLFGQKINWKRNRTIVFIKDDFDGYLYLKPYQYLSYIKNLFKSTISKEELLELLNQFDLKKYEHLLIKDLSQGNRQKLAFISAIASSAKFILFDEAFEHIDFEVIEEVKKELTKLSKNKFILLTSHTSILNSLDFESVRFSETGIIYGYGDEDNEK